MACCGRNRPFTREAPLIVGEVADGEQAVEVEATVSVMTLRRGERAWAKGDGVQLLVDNGWLRYA